MQSNTRAAIHLRRHARIVIDYVFGCVTALCALSGIALFRPRFRIPPSRSKGGLAEARQVAKLATIQGFPLVDNYRIQHCCFVDCGSPECKAL